MPKISENFWYSIIGSFLSVILAMGGFWMMLGRELPTRAEVSKMISTESPYVRDRAYLIERLDRAQVSSEDLNDSIKELNRSVENLRIITSILADKLERTEKKN